MLKLFTQFHVAISLLGIASGFVVVFGMLSGDPLDGWTAFFLATTIATSVTGFMFPFQKLLPSHIVGIISLVLLALAVYARYAAHLAGSFSWIYVVCAVIAQYLKPGGGVRIFFEDGTAKEDEESKEVSIRSRKSRNETK